MKRVIKPEVVDSAYVENSIQKLRQAYRCLHVSPLGQSVRGRNLSLLHVGNGRETVLFAAAFHAQEWMTAYVALRLCERLCAALESGQPIGRLNLNKLWERRTILIVPLVNPDGVDIAIHGSPSAGLYAPAVEKMGGDIPGRWQANVRGVDLNHNFHAGWHVLHEMEREQGISGPSPRQWSGTRPESEPETACLAGLCRANPPHHVLALHSQGEEIYWRYGENTPACAHFMANLLGSASGYRVADPEGLASHGGFKDWFIQQYRRPGFTIELGLGENPLPVSCFEEVYEKAEEMLLLAAMM